MVVPVGGGGLIAGVTVALAARAPRTAMIGVEAAGSPQLSAQSRPRRGQRGGLSGRDYRRRTGDRKLGLLPFELIRGRVHDVASVDDFEIGEAVLLLLERMKLLAEGAGAAALAGAMKLKPGLRGKRVVLLVSGGNIDINLLDRIIGHGLVKAGRLFRFRVKLATAPRS